MPYPLSSIHPLISIHRSSPPFPNSGCLNLTRGHSTFEAFLDWKMWQVLQRVCEKFSNIQCPDIALSHRRACGVFNRGQSHFEAFLIEAFDDFYRKSFASKVSVAKTTNPSKCAFDFSNPPWFLTVRLWRTNERQHYTCDLNVSKKDWVRKEKANEAVIHQVREAGCWGDLLISASATKCLVVVA